MKRSTMAKPARACILGFALVVSSAASLACDMHASAGFGRFPVMHAQLPTPKIEELIAPISLKHAKKVIASRGKQASVPIYYRIPKGYQDVEFSFKASPEITFQEDVPFQPKQESGIYRLKYNAQQSGKHSLTIVIKGKKQNKAYSKIQTIEVVVG